MKKLLLIVAVTSIISLFGCGNKSDVTLPVDAEPMAEVTETEKEPEPVEEEEPDPEPVEEEEEPEEEEDKPLDLDSLPNLKWAMGAFVNLNYNYSAFCSGKEDAIENLLWDMDYYSSETYPNLLKGEEFIGPRDEYGVADGYIRFTIEQAQTAVNSLTGRQVDTSSVGKNGVIELWAVGLIEEDTVCKNWNIEYIGNNTWKVYVDKYRYGYDYDQNTLYKVSEFTFTVIENPESIFDGYSIIEVEEEAPKMPEWAEAYYDYLLENYNYKSSLNEGVFQYFLIYLDNDDIPELYVYAPDFTGHELLYYDGGQIQLEYFSSLSGCQYIPQSGLIMEEWENLSTLDTHGCIVSRLANGEFNVIIDNKSSLKLEYEGEYVENREESWKYDFIVNNEPVSEEEYNRRLNKAFDFSKAIELTYDEGETLYSMLDKLSSQ